MLTRINPKKTYFNSADAQKDILDAMSGDWGNEHKKGLRIIHLGGVSILSGIFGADVETVDVPVSEKRYPAYFSDTYGHVNMVVVEVRQKLVCRPSNIEGGFSFFAVV